MKFIYILQTISIINTIRNLYTNNLAMKFNPLFRDYEAFYN